MSVFRGGQCCVEKGLWIKATVFHPISRLLSVEWVTLRYLNIEYTLSSSIVRYSCREMLQNSIWNPILLYTLFVLHGILCDLSAPMVLNVFFCPQRLVILLTASSFAPTALFTERSFPSSRGIPWRTVSTWFLCLIIIVSFFHLCNHNLLLLRSSEIWEEIWGWWDGQNLQQDCRLKGLSHTICYLSFHQLNSQKKLVRFSYLMLYLGIETFSCGLLLLMARMDIN